jgi:hypothetical protein
VPIAEDAGTEGHGRQSFTPRTLKFGAIQVRLCLAAVEANLADRVVCRAFHNNVDHSQNLPSNDGQLQNVHHRSR